MGVFSSKRFDATTDVPDQTGKVALVTGATSGLGFQTVRFLALNGATVYVGARTEAKVNNAGRGGTFYKIGPEGIESAFVGNYLGMFVLTTTLLPLLKKTARTPGSDVRIVTLSSQAHTMIKEDPSFASLEAFNTFATANLKDADTVLNRIRRYGLAKLADILFAKELERRLLADTDDGGGSIISLPVHPGVVVTEGTLEFFSYISWLLPLWGYTRVQGVAVTLFAATSPLVREKPEVYRGAYFGPFGALEAQTSYRKDEALAKVLWSTSEEVVGDVLRTAGI
ncbi:hypothetical protein RQP46_006980 [Phenoliferia psychrophenolica]